MFQIWPQMLHLVSQPATIRCCTDTFGLKRSCIYISTWFKKTNEPVVANSYQIGFVTWMYLSFSGLLGSRLVLLPL